MNRLLSAVGLAITLQTCSFLFIAKTYLYIPGCENFDGGNTLVGCLGDPSRTFKVTNRGLPTFYESNHGIFIKNAVSSFLFWLLVSSILLFLVSLIIKRKNRLLRK